MEDPASPALEKTADLGILFVHGIGNQKKGETLRMFGEPVWNWLSRWFAGQDEAYPWLGNVDNLGHLTGSDPAHFEGTLVPGDSTQSPKKVLMAECWWADEIQEPRPMDLLIWTVKIAPATVLFHFLDRGYSAWRAFRERVDRSGRMSSLRQLAGTILNAGLMLLLLPLIVGVLGLSLVLALVPVPFMRRAAYSLQRLISSVVGDSFVLVGSPVQRAAILGRLKQDLDWLRIRCDRTCVVAHSQGASVAHRLLTVKPDSFDGIPIFALGSGEGKLAFVEALMQRNVAPFASWLVLPVLIIVGFAGYTTVSLVAELLPVMADSSWIMRVIRGIGGLAMLAAFLAILSIPVFWFLGQAFGPLTQVRLPRSRHRPGDHDFLATSDPVTSSAPVSASTKVRNRGSFLFDHTTYFSNMDEFVGGLVSRVCAFSQIPLPGAKEAVLNAAQRRQKRHGRLDLARTVALLASSIVLLAAWVGDIRLPSVDPAPILSVIGRIMNLEALANSESWSRTSVSYNFAILAIRIAVVWLVYAFVASLISISEKEDYRAYFNRLPYRRHTRGDILFWFSVVFIGEMSLLYGFSYWSMPPVYVSLALTAAFVAANVPQISSQNSTSLRLDAGLVVFCVSFVVLLPAVSIIFEHSESLNRLLTRLFWTSLVVWILVSFGFTWLARTLLTSVEQETPPDLEST